MPFGVKQNPISIQGHGAGLNVRRLVHRYHGVCQVILYKTGTIVNCIDFRGHKSVSADKFSGDIRAYRTADDIYFLEPLPYHRKPDSVAGDSVFMKLVRTPGGRVVPGIGLAVTEHIVKLTVFKIQYNPFPFQDGSVLF